MHRRRGSAPRAGEKWRGEMGAARLIALVSIAIAIGYVFVPVSIAPWTYFAVVGSQSLVGLALVHRRRAALTVIELWLLLAAGIALSATSGVLQGSSYVDPGRPAWSTLGTVLTVLSIVCYGLFGAMVAAPMLGVARLQLPTQAALAGFAAIAMTYLWTIGERSTLVLTLLFAAATVGALVFLIAVAVAQSVFRRIGRPAEAVIGWAGVAFGLSQVVAVQLRILGVASNEAASAIIAVNGLLLAALVHPGGRLVGSQVRQHSDQPRRRAVPIAFAALLLADGVIAIVSQIVDGRSMVMLVGLFAAVQFVVLVRTVAVWIESGLLGDARDRRRQRREIRAGVAGNQFGVQYQPIVEASTGDCVGYEALVRWRHPVHGMLTAEAFVEAAERCGMLAEIDAIVLRRVLDDHSRLVGPLTVDRPFVSLNLAPYRLQRVGVAAELVSRLAAGGVAPSAVIVELSRPVEISEGLVVAENLAAFRRAGVGLAIDRFGVGQANFGLLCQMDIVMVKIDRELIEMAMTTARGAAVVGGTIRTGRAAGAVVVAEGVRDPSWIPRLLELGIDHVQGFGVGVPLSMPVVAHTAE